MQHFPRLPADARESSQRVYSPGEEREVELELKTIADIGMVSPSFQFSSGCRWIPRVPWNSPFPKSQLYVAMLIMYIPHPQECSGVVNFQRKANPIF